MLSLFSFFTKVPIRGDLKEVARQIYYLPLLAIWIALVPILVYYFSSLIFSKIFVALFSLLSLYGATGIMHLDGLADFSDGVMKKGAMSEKIKALKDVNTGVAAMFVIFAVLATELISISSFKYSLLNLILFFLVSELSAKIAMVSGLMFRSYPESGLGRVFKENFNKKKFGVAVLLTILFIPILGFYYVFIFTGLIVAGILGVISTRNFGFVNGDALGAMNELSRAITMVILCVVL